MDGNNRLVPRLATRQDHRTGVRRGFGPAER
jgi:hypothetical protein